MHCFILFPMHATIGWCPLLSRMTRTASVLHVSRPLLLPATIRHDPRKPRGEDHAARRERAPLRSARAPWDWSQAMPSSASKLKATRQSNPPSAWRLSAPQAPGFGSPKNPEWPNSWIRCFPKIRGLLRPETIHIISTHPCTGTDLCPP